jgi:hypothetical protein
MEDTKNMEMERNSKTRFPAPFMLSLLSTVNPCSAGSAQNLFTMEDMKDMEMERNSKTRFPSPFMLSLLSMVNPYSAGSAQNLFTMEDTKNMEMGRNSKTRFPSPLHALPALHGEPVFCRTCPGIIHRGGDEISSSGAISSRSGN